MKESHACPIGPLVGVSAVVIRDSRVLVGRRKGSHGAETWGFPGGKVDPGEHPGLTVLRELSEETGLLASSATPIVWTSDVLDDDHLHYVTLHHLVDVPAGEPRVMEPDKVHEWRWVPWHDVPKPAFAPTASLIAGTQLESLL